MYNGSPVLRFTPNEWRPFVGGIFDGFGGCLWVRHGVPGLLQTGDYAREVRKAGAHQTNGLAFRRTTARAARRPAWFAHQLANSTGKASNERHFRYRPYFCVSRTQRETLMTKNNDPGPPPPG